MEMMNRAIEDASAFAHMLDKVTKAPQHTTLSPEVVAWNAEVERKAIEKLERREFERRKAREATGK